MSERDGTLESAQAALGRGEVPRAIELLRATLQDDPAWLKARILLSEALYRSGDEESALQELRSAQQREPDAFEAQHALGTLLVVASRHTEAIEPLQAALRLRPGEPAAELALAVALCGSGALDEGIRRLRELAQRAPDDPSVHANLGRALADRGELDGAIAHMRRAIELAPGDARLHMDLSRTLFQTQDIEATLHHLRVSLSLDPRSAAAHTALGSVLLSTGETDAGGAHLVEALRLEPNLVVARVHLAIAFFHKGQVDEGIEQLQQVVAIAPDHVPAHANLGQALRSKGRWDEAIEAFRAALALAPEDAYLHYELGQTHGHKGDLASAIECLQRTTQIAPGAVDAWMALCFAHYECGDFMRAAQSARAVLAVDADHTPALVGLGQSLREAGDLDGAVECLERAIRIAPRDYAAHSVLGATLLKKQDVDGAVRHLQTAVELQGDQASAHAYLGLALLERGDLPGAIRELQTSVEIDPSVAVSHFGLARAFEASGARAAALPCYHRAWRAHLHSRGSADRLGMHSIATLASAVLEHDAPLLALQVTATLLRQQSGGSWLETYRRIAERCAWTEAAFLTLELDSSLRELDRVWLRAVLSLVLGDPVSACAMLDEAEIRLDDADSSQPRFQYYLLRAAEMSRADDAKGVRSYAERAAGQAARDPARSEQDLYYAGLILADAPPQSSETAAAQICEALACFDAALRAAPSFLPARYLRAHCLHRLGRTADVAAECAAILQQEASQPDGFSKPLQPIELDVAPEHWIPRIQHLAHAREIQDAMQLVREHAGRGAAQALCSAASGTAELTRSAGLFRTSRRLAEWKRETDERRARELAEAMRHEAPAQALDEVDRWHRDGAAIEDRLGESIDAARSARELQTARLRIQYAFVRRTLDPKQAVSLACYLHVRPRAEQAASTGGAVGTDLISLVSWLGSLAFVDPIASGVLSVGAGAYYQYIHTPRPRTERPAYADFRAGFDEWLLAQSRELSAEEFSRRYPIHEWWPEALRARAAAS